MTTITIEIEENLTKEDVEKMVNDFEELVGQANLSLYNSEWEVDDL